MKRRVVLVSSLLLVAGLIGSAHAAPVVITGFVADLGGVPHTSPNIVVQVRTFPGGVLIASERANPNTGFFRIPIDPATVPDNNTRISIRASGTAVLNGIQTPVRTDGDLVGLAGEIRSSFGDDVGTNEQPVTQFIMLVVPKAKPTCNSYSYPTKASRYYRRWCR